MTDGGVSVIDTGKLSVAPHQVGSTGLRGTLSADGKLIYTLAGKQFVAISTDSFEVVRRLDVEWTGVVSMVASADGFRVYSTDVYSNRIRVIDTAGNNVIGTIQIQG
jgi:YVTN family beta-propeller protein